MERHRNPVDVQQGALAGDALIHVRAGAAADAVLSQIIVGTAHPDLLGKALLDLLQPLATSHRAAVEGFLRNVQKRLEQLTCRSVS